MVNPQSEEQMMFSSQVQPRDCTNSMTCPLITASVVIVMALAVFFMTQYGVVPAS